MKIKWLKRIGIGLLVLIASLTLVSFIKYQSIVLPVGWQYVYASYDESFDVSFDNVKRRLEYPLDNYISERQDFKQKQGFPFLESFVAPSYCDLDCGFSKFDFDDMIYENKYAPWLNIFVLIITVAIFILLIVKSKVLKRKRPKDNEKQ